ncbi:Acetyl-CoA:oxalate CoA-transferase [Cupriavidus laharis]|uniref:Acetyl-CoA:oxalate CoA-transferase n=1 Tax=Cupriavidus laharis TaxID=151654 RepID=A0ABM8WNW0_9BURK|nr:CoA transferase [Cupriavidus laharis]CAG9169098.1 Acetyl-CoA:oxalate CoA-transferase [Cupriavidus laharis]
MKREDIDSSASARPALEGLRVIEFGQFIAVPAAAQALADLGAEVIKIEPPQGDAARRAGSDSDCGPMFAAYNRGKRSVVLDLGSAEDREAARALIGTADVVLQNMRPGTMERHGLGPEAMRQLNPRLVYGSVSGFGSEGAARHRAGFDIAAQAESGMMSLNGEADGAPMRVGFGVVDVMASHALVAAVAAALLRRATSGEGGVVEVSLLDTAIESMAYAWAEYALTGHVPVRTGNGQPTMAPAADLLSTADGLIVVSAYMDEHFARLCTAVGQPDLAADPRFNSNAQRVVNRRALIESLSHGFSGLSRAEACERLAKAGVVAGAICDFAEARALQGSGQFDLFGTIGLPGGGNISLPRTPWRIDGRRSSGGALPALGAHTQEVLQEIGLPHAD